MENFKILHGRQTVDNYPYGRLKCTRHTDLEFKKGKGYRVARQTVNPKTGRLNNPKRSTYSTFMQLVEEKETGYTKTISFSINGAESVDRFILFLKRHEEQLNFTEEESQWLFSSIITTLKIGAQWIKFKKAEEGETNTAIQYLEAIDMKHLIKLYGEKANIKELCDYPHSIKDTQALYEDKESGEAILGFRISN